MMSKRKNGRIYICHTYYHAYIAVVKELVARHESNEKADIMLSTMSNDFGKLPERLNRASVFEHVYMFDEKEDVTSEEVMSYHRDKGNIVANLLQRITYTKLLGKLQEECIPTDLSRYQDVYVFCDSTLKAEAQVIATAAVGFTGMPFLIALMKYLILFILAYEQAMIETAALAMGKRISVITEKSTFMLKIYEVVLCTPGHIQQKAGEYPERSFGISYGDYLSIMMFMMGQKKASYRAMDLIQENIRYEYNEDFYIANCVTGFRVKAGFVVPSEYIAFGGYRVSAEYALKY